MELYILNRKFEIIGIIDSYNSVEWVRRYNETGDFILTTIAETGTEAEPGTIEMLKEGNFIAREDDVMIVEIEKKIITTTKEKGDKITVSGRSIEKILGQRIIWSQTNTKSNETVEDFLGRLIDENAINPTNKKRKIPYLKLAKKKGFANTIEKQITGENLLKAIEEICKTYNYGFRVIMNEDGFLEFELYEGIDKSYEQNVNSYVVFSDEFDNLAKTEYEYDKEDFANAALIGGEGEGSARKYQTIGESEGLERYELFVDAKDISSNNKEVADTEYNKMLLQKGNEKIKEKAIIETFEGETETTNMYKYKEDYDVGDIVQVENKYKMSANARITEIIESDNENGYKIVPTFGTLEG